MKQLSELEIQMDNAVGHLYDIEKQIKACGIAIDDGNPFKLMTELSELQKLVRDAMHTAIICQEEHIKPIKEQAQRIG